MAFNTSLLALSQFVLLFTIKNPRKGLIIYFPLNFRQAAIILGLFQYAYLILAESNHSLCVILFEQDRPRFQQALAERRAEQLLATLEVVKWDRDSSAKLMESMQSELAFAREVATKAESRAKERWRAAQGAITDHQRERKAAFWREQAEESYRARREAQTEARRLRAEAAQLRAETERAEKQARLARFDSEKKFLEARLVEECAKLESARLQSEAEKAIIMLEEMK